ncbi:hypothetical protein SSX86_013684 [Deinandra increscens subsp. villosa]|uniref:BHLH domain-containing protein n=1 Tax=Deinandra increscens subsp. villosa TaxID=3103831 RepID=A0AAP0D5Q7_9ASTR
MSSFSYQQHLSNYLLNPTAFFPDPPTATATWLPADQLFHHYDQVSVANTLVSQESSMSMVLDDHKVDEISGNEFLAKKRKDKQLMSSLNQAQSKDTSNRMKKQKKTNDYQEEKKKKNLKKSGSCDQEEGAVGYIHVRARRGQATDSHSLAERVRREKISERMKLLQAIVPGCDKVTGKALMLDEIINYVQSLQNQVEFLSLKLATVNPISYDFGVDMDTFMLKPDENMSSMGSLPIMPSVQRCSPNGGAATFAPTNDSYNHLPQLSDGSTATNSLLFHQSQMPNIILSQGNGHELWDVDEQRLKLDNRFAVSNNVTSFH